MLNNVSYYKNHNIIGEIIAAIDILLSQYEYCTPTDVLRLAKLDESDTTRRLVLDIAIGSGTRVKKSGRGFRICAEWEGE